MKNGIYEEWRTCIACGGISVKRNINGWHGETCPWNVCRDCGRAWSVEDPDPQGVMVLKGDKWFVVPCGCLLVMENRRET